MTEKTTPYATPALPSAGYLAWGVLGSLLGWPVLAASGYVGQKGIDSVSLSAVLAGIGWVLIVGGALACAAGAYRLAQHADRAAGVRFTRDANGAHAVTLPPAE